MKLLSDTLEQGGFEASPTAPVRRRAVPVALVIVLIGIVLAHGLALPGQTVTTKYVNDLFVFLDGAHRIASGQVPNVDFHTSLGPLSFYIPALGYALSGTMAGAMPVGMALLVVALAAVAAYLVPSRMRPQIGLPFAIFVLLVAAVPANPGEALADLSFAMFYNRIGWAALGLLLVFYLPPKGGVPDRPLLDAAFAAILVLLMLYTKISYGLVGLAFLVLMLIVSRHRAWAGIALAFCVAAGLGIELFWRGTAGHIADLRLASSVSGDLPDLPHLTETVLRNFADIVVYLLVGLLLLLRRRSVRDFLFVGFCCATGILIIDQNFQLVGILTLGASAAVIAELLAREPPLSDRPLSRLTRAGLPMLVLVLILPVSVHNTLALGLHAGLALSRTGDQVPLEHFSGIRLARLWSDGPYFNFVRYNDTLRDGAEALARLEEPAERVLVLDFVGPFSAGLDLPPPQGDSAWHHWGRTINEFHYPPAETLFADVAIIMDPKSSIEIYTADGMRSIYAAHIAAHYVLAEETPLWRVYVARR